VKKPSSLAQQVQQAKKTFNAWTAAEKSSVRLEGSSSTLARFAPAGTVRLQQKSQSEKK
jgi:hypothetical protein